LWWLALAAVALFAGAFDVAWLSCTQCPTWLVVNRDDVVVVIAVAVVIMTLFCHIFDFLQGWF
jgi:hypothetical protein